MITNRRQRARGVERGASRRARLAVAAAWPLTIELDIDGLGNVLVCHATPSLRRADLHADHARRRARRLLGPVDADVLVCGHTHMQYDRLLASGLRVVNPGSVGIRTKVARRVLGAPRAGRRVPPHRVRRRRGRGCDPRDAVTGPRTSSSSSSSIRRRRTRRRSTSSRSVARSYVREARAAGSGGDVTGSGRSSSGSPRSMPTRRSRSASAATSSCSSR